MHDVRKELRDVAISGVGGISTGVDGIAKLWGVLPVSAAWAMLAGALIATVVGLFVAIPAMFAYNFMVTTIRAITQELDAFATAMKVALRGLGIL